MSPLAAQRLAELRSTLDATFSVLADNGEAILVLVQPTDLEPFLLVIDPAASLSAPSEVQH